MSRFYEQLITEDLCCTPEEAGIVEDLMRTQVFHSTLDWQSREQLRDGAKEAFEIFSADREFFLNHYRNASAFVQKMKAEAETLETHPAYEI